MPTAAPTQNFEAGAVVKVPFPYTDRATRQRRPALVVSGANLPHDHGLLWVLMITSAENRGWDGDVVVADLPKAGLPAPSVVRTAKIATINAENAEPLGRVGAKVLKDVMRHVAGRLHLDVR